MNFSTTQKFLISNTDSILIAIAGFVFILMLAHYSGIGISPDSVAYTSVAKSLAAHGQFIQYDEAPYVDFPVGYPIFLSVFLKIFGSDFVHFGIYINAVLFATLILICGIAMRRFTYTSGLYKIVILICIALSPGLLEVYSMLWSETLFILLSVLFIIALHNYLQKVNTSSLIITALIVAFICIVRYAGICVIAAGVYVLFFMKHRSTKQKITHIILFAAIACSLLLVNLIRNYFVQNNLTGDREKGITPFFKNVEYFGTTLYDWLPYSFNHHLPEVMFGLIIIILLAAAVLWHTISGKNKSSFEYIASVFALIYILFMLVTATVSRFETLNSRLFSAAFIPLLWVLAYWLNKLVVKGKEQMRIFFIGVNILLAIFIVTNEYIVSYANYTDIKDYGIPGYTDDDWRLSPTIKYIQSHENFFNPGYEIYSNVNDAVFFFTGHSTQQLPHIQFVNDRKEFYADDHFYLVWINLDDNLDLVTLKDILKNKPMKLVGHFADGSVYVTNDDSEAADTTKALPVLKHVIIHKRLRKTKHKF